MTLAVGPVNSAGQAHAWARSVAAFTEFDAFSFGHGSLPGRRGWAFEVDRQLPHHRLTPAPMKAMLLHRLLRNVSHVAVDSFASLYDRLDRSHVGRELHRLGAEFPDLRVALIAHGSDLRDPARHMARLPESYYRIAPAEWNADLGSRAARNRATARASGLPLFVSTPDLLLEDVSATWLPVVVDPARFAGAPELFSGNRIRVLHLPSRRVPPIKGTDLIDPVLRRLHEAGRIDYVSPTSVPPGEVPALIRSCDVLVEQVRSGYYGVNAVEGMAAGRVVIGSLADDVAAVMPEAPPFVRVGAEGFAATMDSVLDDLDAARESAAAGPGYVHRWHDGRASAEVLAAWMRVADPGAR